MFNDSIRNVKVNPLWIEQAVILATLKCFTKMSCLSENNFWYLVSFVYVDPSHFYQHYECRNPFTPLLSNGFLEEPRSPCSMHLSGSLKFSKENWRLFSDMATHTNGVMRRTGQLMM